jgi:hypothetical protein
MWIVIWIRIRPFILEMGSILFVFCQSGSLKLGVLLEQGTDLFLTSSVETKKSINYNHFEDSQRLINLSFIVIFRLLKN